MSFYSVIRAIVTPIAVPFFAFPKVIGKENIEYGKEGSVIYCANHRCNYDPVLVGMYVNNREIHFMAKKVLFRNRLFGWFITKMHAFSVDRDSNDIASIKHALKVLKNGQVLGIFPEGKRNKSNELLPFLEGVGLLAHCTKTVVIPVGIKNNYGFMRRPTMEIGAPIDFSREYEQKGSSELYQAMSDKIRARIEELVNQ